MPSLTFAIGTGTGTRGGSTILPITIVSTGTTNLTTIQWTFSYSGDISSVVVTAGPTTILATKTVTNSNNTYMVYGINTNTITDGTLAVATFSISPVPFDQNIPIPVSEVSVIAADTAGLGITVNTSSGAIQIFSNLSTQIILGHARISKSTTRLILGKASIVIATNTAQNKTILGKSRIQVITTKTIQGKASIANIVTTRNITGKSRILLITQQNILGKASLTSSNTTQNRTIQGLARITANSKKNLTGKAAIRQVTLTTIIGQARITVNAPPSVIVIPEQLFRAL